MRLLGTILLLCVAAAVLRYVVVGLALILVIVILLGVFTGPAETFGLLLFALFAQAMTHHTVATLAFLSCAGLCLAITGRSAGGNRPDQPS